ncbi:FliM/FliN family flagellar motor switch protein [Roseovarius aestuarii]|uniref:Flagellar motor switch protein FliM n=1 Tax=Roseovarius aestuarii TaxID=475083 RepID=A0A1X7BSH9_9RHOB|nr:FliM/FliN family flagellar motor switch protein [Roseovarius aestuarii]SMC12524.1 flagellar motor switch protein FliM [Roseovarius aestuarii]
MGIDEKKSIIHRKAKGGRDEFDARVMSSAKSLRLSLAKVADKMFGLAVTVTTVEQVKLSHQDVKTEAGDDGLLLLLDGPVGARGAVAVDTQVLTALIEVQTTGGVRQGDSPSRPVTRTDAAIVAPFMDAVLRRYDTQLTEADPDHVEENYRFGDMIEDARTLALALEAPEYDLYRLTLDIEEGAKTGILKLLLPHREIVQMAARSGDRKSDNSGGLEKHLLEAQVVMDAVLTRLRLPLNEICALRPGMTIPLDAGALSKTQLVVSGGHVAAKAKMGQVNGMRAVRLLAPATTETLPETGPSGRLLKADRSTHNTAMQDDVVDGVAHPAEEAPVSSGPGSAMTDTSPPPGGAKPDELGNTEADQAGAGDAGELSAEELALAANALQASVRDERENA